MDNQSKSKEAAEQSEKKYRSMYDMFRLMADNSPDMFWAKDLNGKFIFANKAVCEKLLIAKDTDEPIGKNDMFYAQRQRDQKPDDPDWFTFGEICINSDEAVLKNRKPQRFDEFGNVQGEFLFLDVYKAPLRDHNGIMIGTVGSARIVTKEKEIEKKLEESKKLLEKAQLIAKIGYYSCDLKTNKRTWSEQLFNIIELDSNEQELSVKEMTKYMHPGDREKFLSAVNHAIENNSELDVTFRIFTKNDDLRYLRDIGEVVYDKKNDSKILAGSIQDITDQVKAKEELIKAKEKAEEADRLKSAFLANMSHELRTPLNSVLGFSQLLFDAEGNQQKIDKYAGIIQSSGKHLLHIIEDILDLSIIESGEIKLHVEDVHIDDLFDEILDILKSGLKNFNKTHIHIRHKRPPYVNNIIINTDAGKLKQILINLLKNAIKFTNEGYIEYGYTIEENQHIRFYVKDTGIGIPEDKYEVIFERFVQLGDTHTKTYDGTGLGLSINKKLVELLKGEIWCESEVGKGSTFYFYLPVTFTEEVFKVNKMIKSFEDVNWSNRTILVAEDEDYSFNLLEILLKKSKTIVLRAKNGYEAIDICKSNPKIDLVLMDIRMPSMDGLDATKKLKQLKPELPVIAQTAYAMLEDKDKIFKSGCDDYIAKPLNWDHLFNKLNKYL